MTPPEPFIVGIWVGMAFVAICLASAVGCFIGAVRGPGLFKRFHRLVAMAIWALLGGWLAALLLFWATFRVFSKETLVAYASTVRHSPTEFTLWYKPVDDPSGVHHQLRGDQWSISGGIVKWHPLLTVFGMKSYHREMRLSGQFSDLARQRSQPPTVYSLQSPLQDKFWEAMYWMDPYLLFVEAVYGSSAYAYAEPGRVQAVYVNHSGYLIKRSSLKEIPVTDSPG